MKLVLNIRVLAGMDVQQFVIPLDLAGPATLKVEPGDLGFGRGHKISILDEDDEPRMWFAHELIGLRFEWGAAGTGGQDERARVRPLGQL